MKFFRTASAALFTALFLVLGAGCDPQTVIPPRVEPEPPVVTPPGNELPSWEGVVINEAYSRGKGAANPEELDWVELYNSSDKSVDVGGLVLTDKEDKSEKVTVAEGTTIASKGFLVVDVDIEGGFGLSSGGDRVWLFDPEGAQLDHVEFDAMREEESWSAFPDGSGEFRMQSVTKGTSNDTGEVIPPVVVGDYTGLVINEIDGNGKFVELYNSSDAAISLSGVYLVKNEDKTWWTAGSEATIAAGGFYAVGTNGDKDLDPAVSEDGGGSGISPKQILKFTLNAPDENEIDSFERSREGMVWGDGCLPDYGKSDPKYSFSRCPDGTGSFGLAVPSCNAANPQAAAGPIVTDNPIEPKDDLAVATLRINTKGQGAPNSKENYITVDLTIEDPDLFYGNVASETIVTEIRGRGNTTWGMPKKPYKLKLDKKKRLLGMSDNKHWTLLANYSDKSLLRNSLAFKIGELAGMEWLPRWVPVEVYMDGRYEGQYMLTEQVRTGDERIEMELAGASDNSGEALTGGYLFCIDEKDLNDAPVKVGFWHRNDSGSQFPVAFDEPEDPTQAQIDYVKGLFKGIEEAIYRKSFTEFSKVIDVESVIDYFFVHELAKDPDGNMRLSTYMAKPRGGKLYFPTVWDFDISFGNCNYADNNSQMGPNDGGFWNPSGGWPTRDAVWIRQLFRNKEFCDLVTVRWNELKPQLAQLETFIRGWANDIADSQKRNFERWPILGVEVWPNWNAGARRTYKAEVDFLVDFINRRVAWLDGEIKAGRHRL